MTPTLEGEQVTLGPVVPSDAARLKEIHAMPAVARWWHEPPSRWPLEDRSSASRFTVRLRTGIRGDPVGVGDSVDSISTFIGASAVIGFVQYTEDADPDHRHASMDVFLDPAVHGRGLGVDTVRTMARYLVHDRGHHHLVIDPAADNAQAIRCYTLVGFRPVGILRSYERDPATGDWRDGLLMDALAGELRLRPGTVAAPVHTVAVSPAPTPAVPARTAPGRRRARIRRATSR